MSLTNNLLYLFLLYAVLDRDNNLSLTTALLIALGIMAFGLCCNPQINCCPRQNTCPNAATPTTFQANPFFLVNSL